MKLGKRVVKLFCTQALYVYKFLRYIFHPLLHIFLLPISKISNLKSQISRRLPPFMRTLWFRTTCLVLAILIILPSVTIFVTQYMKDRTYKLSKIESSLVGESTIDKSLIKESDTAILYNRADEAAPSDIQKVLELAANKEDSTGKKPYQAELNKDPAEGITFSDSEGDRSVTLKPQFNLAIPRLEDGRVIYPDGTNERHIYTFKKNGIKSDIVLNKAPKEDKQTYTWNLSYGSDLEAKTMPDGSIGIYSTDPLLYGDLQVGDQKSQELLDNARKNGEKNYLIFELPKPFIVNSSGDKNYQDVSYRLDKTNKTLNLDATNLQNQSYPLSIDPTITVTTTSDFRQNTGDTGNTDYGTDGEIRRGTAGSGIVGTTTQQAAAFTTGRVYHTSVAYNGYLYIIGGCSAGSCSAYQNDIQYCPINTNGSIGTCTQQAAAFTTARQGHTSVVYNGYLYIIGGYSGSYQDDIQYCPINANGSVGTCTQQTSAFTTARSNHTSVVYNGYLYIIGGYSGSYQNDIQYCPINANGSVGTCTQQTSAFTTARRYHTSVAYNGYLYIVGGYSGINHDDIQYCPINANGSVGTCTQQASAFTTARYSHTSVVSGGYMYIIGGTSGSSQNDIQYCPINTNGSVGTCTQQTSAFTTARYGHTSVVSGGYMYIIGGFAGAGFLDDIQYLPLAQPPNSAWVTDTGGNFSGIRYGHGGVIYGGYYFVFGGNQNGGNANDMQSAPINSDGSIGTWDTNAMAGANPNFTNARRQFAYFVYNGYIYLGGGWDLTNNFNDIQYALLCNGSNNGVGGCGSVAGEVGTWAATTSFTSIRRNLAGTAYNGYAYILGGNVGSAFNDVQYAFICDGTATLGCTAGAGNIGKVGTWTATTSFTTARYGMATIAYNGYLYILGGSDLSSVTQNDVQYALICTGNNNGVGGCGATAGAVGTWATTSSFTTARTYLSVAINDNKLYLVGGDLLSASTACKSSGSTNWCSDTQYATFNSDGTVGTWTTSSQYMTNQKMGHSTGILNGYLYVVGGVSNNTYYNDALYLNIDKVHGGIGANTNQAAAFTTARQDQSSVAYNGYLYIIGGYSGSYQNDIQYCAISTTGSIGACTVQAAAFTTARSEHTSVAYNGYLYIIGGCSAGTCTTYQNDIQYCPINANGSVGGCTVQASAFTTARREHSSVAYNGYLYIIGGYSGSNQNDIQYCPINSSGSVGGCTQQTSAFTTARYEHTSVAYNGWLYIIGGYDGAIYLGDIQYCPINSNGSIGTCNSKGGGYDFPRGANTSVAYNGYLYVIGGTSGSRMNDVVYCPIRSNGQIDQCGAKMAAFTTARDSHSIAAANGYLYVIGGCSSGTCSTYQNDINYFSVGAPTYSARYERVIDTGSSASKINSFTINGTATCNYSVSYKLAGSDNIFGSATTIPSVVSGVSQSVNISDKRYVLIIATLDDTTCGATSSISSISLAYDQPASVPTLILPVASATAVSVLPEFRLGSSDVSGDYLRYTIQVCSNSDCSSVLRTIDQTSSQTGWISQSQQSGTAYSSDTIITQLAIHQYQPTALSASTQYWWRGRAIDPGGINAWSSYSSISTFTTGLSESSRPQVNIKGNVNIGGDVIIKP